MRYDVEIRPEDTFGEVLRKHRKDRQWTQADFAAELHMTSNAYGLIERDSRRTPKDRKKVIKFADTLRLNSVEKRNLLLRAGLRPYEGPIGSFELPLTPEEYGEELLGKQPYGSITFR